MKIPQRPTTGGESSREKNRLERAAARNQSAHSKASRPLLDPHGIYGTRTAYRLRSARRRQALQNLMTVCLIIACIAALVWWTRERRIVALSRTRSIPISDRMAALPAWASTGKVPAKWIVPTASGFLLTVDADTGVSGPRFQAGFPFRAQPLIVNDIAFAPAEDGTLYAVSWMTGRSIWSFRSDSTISGRPAYTRILTAPTADSATEPNADESARSAAETAVQQLVIVGDDSGLITGLRTGSGRVVWQRRINAPIGDGISAAESVRIGNDLAASRVLVPYGAGAGTLGGMLCLDARNGRIVWRAELGAAQLSPPAIDVTRSGGRVVCAGDNGAVVALDLLNGRKLWKTFVRPLHNESAEAVVLRGEALSRSYSWGERVFVGGNDGGLRCLDASSGRELWRFEAGYPIRSRPRAVRRDELVGERELILTGCDGPYAYAIDAATGALVWKMPTNGIASAAPQILADEVITVTREGWLEAFASR
jgi:hypothetical protein